VILLGIYLSVLPDRLSGKNYAGDSGDFLTAMLVGGIPHPSGYPSYMLLGILVQSLPLGTPYWRGALLSAVPAALAAGLLGYWVTRWGAGGNNLGWLAGIAAGIAAGISPGIWSQAVIVEVYGLESLFIVLVLVWIALLSQSDPAQRNPIPLFGFALCFGLGLGTHLTLILLAPIILYAAWTARRNGMPWKWLAAQAGAVLLGLLVYLYLPMAAQGYPPVNWGNPQTWNGFFWEVTGQPYRGLVFGLELARYPERIAAWANLLWQQFGLPGLLIGVVGAIQFPFQQKLMRAVLAWTFLVFSIFAIGYRTDDSIAYLIPAYLIFATWIGLGILLVLPVQWRKLPVGIGLGAAILVSLVIRIPDTRAKIDPRTDYGPAVFASEYLAAAPPSAILFASGGKDAFPLWFAHFGQKQRPDVAVVVLPLTQFAWYQQTLIHTYPDLAFPAIDLGAQGSTRWGEKIPDLNPDRAICRSTVELANPGGIIKECRDPR